MQKKEKKKGDNNQHNEDAHSDREDEGDQNSQKCLCENNNTLNGYYLNNQKHEQTDQKSYLYDGGEQAEQASANFSDSNQTVDYEQQGQILNYQQAIRRTIGPKNQCSFNRYIFQILILFVALIAANSSSFIICGLPFMKSEPRYFECKESDQEDWHPCDKKYICFHGLTKEQYRADKSDSQYIENWQDQTNMLCESKGRIGLLGASFFIGILVASTVIPVGYLSDRYGRKWVFLITLIVLAIACAGFIFAKTLEELYIYMFLLGTTFPGRIIIGQNYAMEFQKTSWIEYIQPINQYVFGTFLILTAVYFEFISKRILYIEIAHYFLVLYLILQTLISFPESPRWNYSKEQFDTAKNDLEFVSSYNGVKQFNKQNFKFDTEKQLELYNQKASEQDGEKKSQNTSILQKKKDGGNEFGLTWTQFVLNVCLMSLLATFYSFSYWLLDFQAEYLGTDIYILFYAQGIVAIISGYVNLLLYERLGLKFLVIIMQSINILAGIYMVLVQQKQIKFSDPKEEELFVEVSVPVALGIMSLSIQVGFTAVYQTAFQDERIFPFRYKTTATNIMVLISKTITIAAPFVNELDEPIPIIVIISLSFLSIILVLFFKNKSELDKMKKVEIGVQEDSLSETDLKKKELGSKDKVE